MPRTTTAPERANGATAASMRDRLHKAIDLVFADPDVTDVLTVPADRRTSRSRTRPDRCF